MLSWLRFYVCVGDVYASMWAVWWVQNEWDCAIFQSMFSKIPHGASPSSTKPSTTLWHSRDHLINDNTLRVNIMLYPFSPHPNIIIFLVCYIYIKSVQRSALSLTHHTNITIQNMWKQFWHTAFNMWIVRARSATPGCRRAKPARAAHNQQPRRPSCWGQIDVPKGMKRNRDAHGTRNEARFPLSNFICSSQCVVCESAIKIIIIITIIKCIMKVARSSYALINAWMMMSLMLLLSAFIWHAMYTSLCLTLSISADE